MGSEGGSLLLGLLLILSALCHSGHSLQCYTCRNPLAKCTTPANCTRNEDACIQVQAEAQSYYQCWKFEQCSYNDVSKLLGESKLQYRCCQKDLCNDSGRTHSTATAALLVTQLLAVFWGLSI